MKKILVTGSAGFIGFHLSKQLLQENNIVHGIDSITSYYDVKLKKSRNDILLEKKNYSFSKTRLEDKEKLKNIFNDFRPHIIIHLAAQAGVRYSISDPESYLQSNLIGTFNILEASRQFGCEHLLLASTSSVYGGNVEMPYREIDPTDTPLSFYAATKKSNEIMSHSYSHLFKIPTTCFRFFTVYGPWGRPDMALFKFTSAILNNSPIEIFNKGEMDRDFTYVDDLVDSIIKLSDVIPLNNFKMNKKEHDSLSMIAPWRVVNIGSANPRNLMDFIDALEKSLGLKAKKRFLGMQPGDVPKTFADNSLLSELVGIQKWTKLEIGIDNFVKWYRSYYKL